MKSLTLFETEQGESSQLFLGCEIDKKNGLLPKISPWLAYSDTM